LDSSPVSSYPSQITLYRSLHAHWQSILEFTIQEISYLDFLSIMTGMGTSVRCSSHRGGSPQDGLRDEQTCGTTLASAYMLCRLSATWSQLQIIKRKSEWK